MTSSAEAPQYLPVPFEGLHTNVRLPFTLYLLLPTAQKYVIFRAKDDVLEAEKYLQMQKNQSRFFVSATEEGVLKEFLAKKPKEFVDSLHSNLNVGNGQTSENATRELRLKSIENFSKFLDITIDPSHPDAGTHLSHAVQEKIQCILDEIFKILGVKQSLIKQIETFLSSPSTANWNHSSITCALSVMIAAALGKTDKKTLTDIATAAFTHELGLETLGLPPPERGKKWTGEEWLNYKTHPLYSLEAIEILNLEVSEIAKLMVYQHEERFDGSGFPQGLKGPDIIPGAQIISLADHLEQLISPMLPGALTPQAALESLWKSNADPGKSPLFHPQYLEQLMESGFQAGVFFDPTKEAENK